MAADGQPGAKDAEQGGKGEQAEVAANAGAFEVEGGLVQAGQLVDRAGQPEEEAGDGQAGQQAAEEPGRMNLAPLRRDELIQEAVPAFSVPALMGIE